MITVKTVPCVLLGRVNSKIIIVGYLCQTYITRVDLEWVGGGRQTPPPPGISKIFAFYHKTRKIPKSPGASPDFQSFGPLLI